MQKGSSSETKIQVGRKGVAGLVGKPAKFHLKWMQKKRPIPIGESGVFEISFFEEPAYQRLPPPPPPPL
jgi:hypothetical protein